MKTLKDWLIELPIDIYQRAMKNTKKAHLSTTHQSFSAALQTAFSWQSSPEGLSYWRAVSKKNYDEATFIIEVKKRMDEYMAENTPEFPIDTLDDQIKLAHLSIVWQDYTAAEIEALLPPKK